MRKCRVLLAFLIVLALAFGVSAQAASPPAAGSFLKYKADSVQSLVKQVSSDKTVAARYTQHFKTSKQTLVAYFQDNLKLSTLRKPTVTTVYYINKSGKVVKGKRLLPAGTSVFMTKTGEPLLDWRCGNPLRASLPMPPKKVASNKPAAASASKPVQKVAKAAAPVEPVKPEPLKLDPVVEKVLPSPPTEIAALPFATTPAITAEAVVPAVITATPMVSPPAVEAIATAPTAVIPPVISSGGGKGGFLLPLALLGGIGAAVSGGGGGGGGSPSPTVPEPSGMAALASGMIGMAGYFLRRSRR